MYQIPILLLINHVQMTLCCYKMASIQPSISRSALIDKMALACYISFTMDCYQQLKDQLHFKNTDFFISLAQNEECLSTKMKCTDTKIQSTIAIGQIALKTLVSAQNFTISASLKTTLFNISDLSVITCQYVAIWVIQTPKTQS